MSFFPTRSWRFALRASGSMVITRSWATVCRGRSLLRPSRHRTRHGQHLAGSCQHCATIAGPECTPKCPNQAITVIDRRSEPNALGRRGLYQHLTEGAEAELAGTFHRGLPYSSVASLKIHEKLHRTY